MSIEALPGEVWAVDFGLVAKQRPVLVLAFPQPRDARASVVVVPLTSQRRGLRGEVDIGKPRWLPKPSSVNVQGMASIDQNALLRKLGKLSEAQFESVKTAIRDLLDLQRAVVPRVAHLDFPNDLASPLRPGLRDHVSQLPHPGDEL